MRRLIALLALTALLSPAGADNFAKPPPKAPPKDAPTDKAPDKTADKPDDKAVPPPTGGKASPLKAKALSSTVEKGLAWLASHQLKGGGWGQGDESAQMGNSM